MNTFVLLTEENNKAIKFPGTDTFMYDYDSRPLRPREISKSQVTGDFGCTQPVNNYLLFTPCGIMRYPAIIDQCVIQRNLGNPEGYSLLNGCYMPSIPYLTYFDFGTGNHDSLGVASNGVQNGGRDGTWGWDDTKWFALKIDSACRRFWMGDAICRLRTFDNGSGFMIAPGILGVGMLENHKNYDSLHINPTANGSYVLADELNVKNEIINKWTPSNNATIKINKECKMQVGYISKVPCPPNVPCPPSPPTVGLNEYTLSILNADFSTVYTWHIKNPDGTWQPFTYGNKRIFYPQTDGKYTIYLRQDNLGNYTGASFYGIKTLAYTVILSSKCRTNGQMLLKSKTSKDQDNTVRAVRKGKIDDYKEFNKYIKSSKFYYLKERNG